MGAVKHAVGLKVAGAAEADATHTRCSSIGGAAGATAAAATSIGGVTEGRTAGAVVGADAAKAGGQTNHGCCDGKVIVIGGCIISWKTDIKQNQTIIAETLIICYRRSVFLM